MNNFARFAISHARVTWLMLLVIVVGGMFVFTTHPRQEDPEITIRSAQVVTQLPGLSPERIEELVTRPIEQKIKTIPEIEEITSISLSGISIVTPSVDSRYNDMTPIWADLRNKMDDVASQLPEGTLGPIVNDDYGRVSTITIALTGTDYTLAELREVARDLQDTLGTLPLVARVDLYGVQDERIWINFDPAFLSQFGLETSRIVSAIQGQNIVLPGGTVEVDSQNIVVEPSGDFESLDELREISIETSEGQVVYLEDLATIERGYVDPPQSPAFFNGKPAIVLGVSMISRSNVVELGKQVTASLALERRELPVGMDLDVVIYQPDLVQKSVADATENLLQTIVVVLLVVMAFLGFRLGLIVGAMVPMVIMITLIGMLIWGIELHRISIAAIIVALGLLVDNGVVIAEDIQRRFKNGEDRLEAALSTPGTLAMPLLTSSLTSIMAFMPLVLISGGSGEFLRSLGQVLAIALLSSWFFGITVTPALCYWFFPKSVATKSSNDGGESSSDDGESAGYTALPYRFYRALLGRVLRMRLLFVVLMVVLLVGSVMIFTQVKKRSLGPSERNQFTVYVDLPSEASIQETMRVTARLTAFLNDPVSNPEVRDVLSYIGSGGPRFFLSLSPNDPQPNKAFLVVSTEQSEQIHEVMPRVNRFILEQMPEADGRTETLALGSTPQGTVEFRVTGEKIGDLRGVEHQISRAFRAVEGVIGLRNDWENSVFKLRVDIDQNRARRAGVTSQDVARTLSGYFDGVVVTSFREGDTTIPVLIRAHSADRASIDRVRTIEVMSVSRGVPVPLLQVADFRGIAETSRIRRLDQQRCLTVTALHPDLTAVELYERVRSAIEAIEVPEGCSIELGGEIEDSAESNGNLFEYAPHAMFVILLLLVLQFNSFRRMAIIMLTIPLVLIGANFGLWVFKGYFDFTAMLGVFSLAGIIINNGIVMIDRIDIARGNGLGVNDAIIDAALARSRPIIMTTATTIAGLLPLALLGGEFWYGMAIVIMCGLGVGTLLTLGFVPVMYSLFFGLRSRSNAEPRTERASKDA